ncbi:MAG: metalloregulator ArsR/SmtB family transcription factor [Lachnospiraceae bacterium]|nr:metalloregulator ArsR/SmtB family transcription factor [Lachnospiraceae bacterium]
MFDVNNEDIIYDLADLFKMFADSTRLRIMYALTDGEKNVGELAEDLSMNQSAISHQLSTLKAAKLVKARRDKKSMYYSLADDHVESIIKIGVEHVLEP